MFKKAISLFVILAMLVPFSSAVAADGSPAKPTVEEILNDYHQKSFEEQNAQKESTASAYSRSTSNSDQSFNRQAVERLTEVGYEAYNVTTENYQSLESSLNSDFSEFGLDPGGSYIVVVHGAESLESENNSTAPTPRAITLPPHVWDDPSPGDSTFTYTYNGVTYTMRYVAITSLDEPEFLYVNTPYVLSNAASLIDLLGGLADIALAVVADKITSSFTQVPVTAIVEMGLLFSDWLTDTGLEALDPNSITMYASTRWTRSYIQVRNPDSGKWHTSQCSAYAHSKAYCDAGLVYNPLTGEDEPCIGDVQEMHTYSPFYNSSSTRILRAARGYLSGETLYDYTDDIHFYFATSDGLVVIGSDEEPLFIHEEDTSYLLPSIQDN